MDSMFLSTLMPSGSMLGHRTCIKIDSGNGILLDSTQPLVRSHDNHIQVIWQKRTSILIYLRLLPQIPRYNKIIIYWSVQMDHKIQIALCHSYSFAPFDSIPWYGCLAMLDLVYIGYPFYWYTSWPCLLLVNNTLQALRPGPWFSIETSY